MICKVLNIFVLFCVLLIGIWLNLGINFLVALFVNLIARLF